MNNITIGQYIPGTSWLHKADPRIKIISLIVLIVAIFLVPIMPNWENIAILGGFLVFSIVIVISAQIPLKKVLNGLKALVFLLVFMVIIQLLSDRSESVILFEKEMYISWTSLAAIILLGFIYLFTKKFFPFKTIYFIVIVLLVFVVQMFLPYGPLSQYVLYIKSDGILRSTFLFLRIVNVVIITSLFTFSTMTTDINYAIDFLLKPLKYLKIPVDIFAMMLSLTLRNIPTLMIETNKIMKAQASRGVDFKESGIKDKLRQVISLIIPIFVISFKKSEELADAMEVRDYVISAKRSRIDESIIKFSDILILIISLLFITSIILFRVLI